MRLCLYLRVSTTSQVDGFGLDVQEADARAWAAREGHSIVLVCRDEGKSGALDALDREGLTCAIGAVEADEADGILCSSLSRLARALHVQEAALSKVWQHGGRVFTVEDGEVLADDPDDPMRKAMRQMAGVFFELDKALIRKRLRAGRAAKAAAGGYIGGPAPYGFEVVDGVLVEVEAEQEVIDRVQHLREVERLSIRNIVAALNESDYRPRSGKQWHINSVTRILG